MHKKRDLDLVILLFFSPITIIRQKIKTRKKSMQIFSSVTAKNSSDC